MIKKGLITFEKAHIIVNAHRLQFFPLIHIFPSRHFDVSRALNMKLPANEAIRHKHT